MYLHGGLLQRREDRLVCNNNIVRSIDLNLPLFLTVPLWERHGYSLSDIAVTLEFFSAIYLWQTALFFDISPSNSAIKLSFSSPESMVYGSKAIVIRKILRHIRNTYSFNTGASVLDTGRVSHIPPLPVHKIDHDFYHQLLEAVPTEEVDMLGTIQFKRVFTWRSIWVVPMWLEDRALYCVRVVTPEDFQACGRQNKCLSNRPLDVRVGDTRYCGVEEALFFELR